MTTVLNTVRVLRYAAATGFADFFAVYTWRTWIFGWLSRVLCQVAFFALIGQLVDTPGQTRFLLVGNAVTIAAMESSAVVASTTWERRAGTLPLLVASPADPAVVFCGRSVHWIVSGVVTSLTSLLVLGPFFGLRYGPAQALAAAGITVVVSLSSYTFCLVLAGLVLRRMGLRNIVGNLASLSMMAFCGVQVPTDFWPRWVAAVAAVLPVTHGLSAMRALLDGAGAGRVLPAVLLEAVVGVGWAVVAALTFRRLAERGRADGSIEFGD
ncbi:ABC transporter permease [Streptomyces sp. NBC_00829]|uniref:ABC transporter permease n=1 Tax=Streptomyces sp. NBC_00829 TaxID=2903679 RepID=UPI0038669F5A|nr:ABC transporter permease [Streptomyces sp. NBC_00829]